MTLVILAIDALDAALVEYFEIGSFKLKNYNDMETFANMKDDPYTPEVWASVATGLSPEQHGVTNEGTSQWSNPLLELASKFTGTLPQATRAALGDFAKSVIGGDFTIGTTDSPTMFDRDGATVHMWPGVASSDNVIAMWDLMRENNVSGVPVGEFKRRAYGAGIQQMAWAHEMLYHNLSLAGTHIHTLDVCGHAFATNEKSLEESYEKVGGWVDRIHDNLDQEDDLLILSDHGMQTSFFDDEESGKHSFRAFASTTKDVTPPKSVFQVKNWVEENTGDYEEREDNDVELPTETLRDLGYIE